MRYLFTTLLILFAATANAQSPYDKAKPYIDWYAGGGVLLPVTKTQDELIDHVGWVSKTRTSNMAGLGELGFDVLFRTRPTQVCLSVGCLGGYSALRAKDTAGNEMDGSVPHGAFTAGLNYLHHSDKPNAMRISLLAGGGIRADFIGLYGFGSGFYFFRGSVVKYFNRTFGAALNFTRYNNLNTRYEIHKVTKYGSTESLGRSFNPWAISIQVIVSVARNRSA